uniref:Nitroreductase domain-containing protein n=1 Tax=Mesocestoides corti TaxID=53468 RepID=A0A5K3FNN8_MESCO
MDDESFLQVYKSKVPRQLFARATNQPDGADMLDHLASANPVSVCVLMACKEDKQPTREGHD